MDSHILQYSIYIDKYGYIIYTIVVLNYDSRKNKAKIN